MGQKSPREIRGDSYFENFAFHDAIEQYTRALNLSSDGQRNLALSYKRTHQFLQAERAFEILILNEKSSAEDIYNYAFVLRINGKYNESNRWMERFYELSPNDLRARSFRANVSELPYMREDQGRYRINSLIINTEYQEFGTSYYGNRIVFASSRRKPGFIRRTYSWNEQPFLSLYLADFDGRQLTNPRLFDSSGRRSKWHEGPASFARENSMMAFTRNHYDASSPNETVNLGIYFRELLRNGKWSEPIAFHLNNPEYSVSHPFLTEDGNVMFFSSNMPGGKGGADIYKVRRNTDGTWGTAVNLENVNTEGDEFFPFYHEKEQLLFFSSNGHFGLGGLDIFIAPRMRSGEFSIVINAGFPLNTRYDDFAIIMDRDLKTGFFSSNREGGAGDDDIYHFELLKPFVFGKIIAGTISDQFGDPVPQAEVVLFDTLQNEIIRQRSMEDGSFEMVVDTEQQWFLHAQKEGYFENSITVFSSGKQQPQDYTLILEKDPDISLYFSVINQRNRQPVAKARIELTNLITGDNHVLFTSTRGDTIFQLPDKRINDTVSFKVKVEIPGYLTISEHYERVFNREGRYHVFDELGVSFNRIEPGKTRLEELVNIQRIDFDMYRHTLRAETILELDKVIEVLNQNPTLSIEIGSHTDCRGSTQLNQQLSARRAQTMAEYVRARVSNSRRVTYRGYGRTVLLNECDCVLIPAQFCTEDQHAENRRTEFLILKQ